MGSSRGHALNRALDVAIAGTGLAITSPVLALAALAVKLDGGGPVLFRQTRVGKDGADFELLKLRTMIVGAEQQGAGYAVDKGDSRITRVGRFLRRTSIDELPQLWNVVRGDMSVIGPRPTLRYQVEKYTDRQRRRLEVLPGITGWAQIHGPRVALLGRANRARRLVRRPSLAAHRPADPAAHAARALRRHLQGQDRRLAEGRWRLGAAALTLALLAALALVAVWNALHYPPGLGYDAIDHIAYAEGIRAGDGLPDGIGEYYTPPGFYTLAAGGDGARRPDRARRSAPAGSAAERGPGVRDRAAAAGARP